MKKCEVELMKKRCSGKVGAVEENQEFRYALRKFLNPSEIFAMHKFSLSKQNFASLAKMTVHSENFEFRYALYFRYASEILLA